MAQSFLPFCAHCENQIVVPNTSILFCSEKCRRKDEAKPPPLPLSGSAPSTVYHANNPYGMTPPLTPHLHGSSSEFFDAYHPPKNYVEPFCPTPPRSVRGSTDDESNRDNESTDPITISRTSSARSIYRSGYASPNESVNNSPTNSNNIYVPPRRPSHFRSLTAGSITTLSSANSSHQPPNQYVLQQRPLPPLHHPTYSSSPRSIDLVTPFLPTPRPHTPTYERSDNIVYEKKSPLPEKASPRSGSLKTLFDFDAIRSGPPAPPAISYSSRYGTPSPPFEREKRERPRSGAAQVLRGFLS